MIFVDKWGWAKFFWANRTLESVTSSGWDPLCADPFLGKCARCSNTKEVQQKYNGNTIEIQTGCGIYCELLSIAFELAFVSWSAFGFSFSLFQFKLKDQYKSKHICTIGGENMIQKRYQTQNKCIWYSVNTLHFAIILFQSSGLNRTSLCSDAASKRIEQRNVRQGLQVRYPFEGQVMIFTGCQFIIDLNLNMVVIFSSDCYCAFNHIFNGGDHGEILMISK